MFKDILKIFMEFIGMILKLFFSFVGIFWTAMEILTVGFPNVEILQSLQNNGMACVIVAGIVTLIRMYFVMKPKTMVETKSISVKYGNIMRCKNGSIVVGINNQFRSDPQIIGRDSLHAQLIQKYGRDRLTQALSGAENRNIIPFAGGNEKRDYVLLKMSDINGFEQAATNETQLVEAIRYLFWHQLEYSVQNHTIYMPLIGTGNAGGPLSRQKVLDLIVREFVCFQNKRQDQRDMIEKLVIVVRRKDFLYVNPMKISANLKQMPTYCSECNAIEV